MSTAKKIESSFAKFDAEFKAFYNKTVAPLMIEKEKFEKAQLDADAAEALKAEQEKIKPEDVPEMAPTKVEEEIFNQRPIPVGPAKFLEMPEIEKKVEAILPKQDTISPAKSVESPKIYDIPKPIEIKKPVKILKPKETIDKLTGEVIKPDAPAPLAFEKEKKHLKPPQKKAMHQSFYNSLQCLSGEAPSILAGYISKYAKSIQLSDADTAAKLFAIVKQIKG